MTPGLPHLRPFRASAHQTPGAVEALGVTVPLLPDRLRLVQRVGAAPPHTEWTHVPGTAPGLVQQQPEDVLHVLVLFGRHLHEATGEALIVNPVKCVELLHLSAVLQVRHGAHDDARDVLVVTALLLDLRPQLLDLVEGILAGDGIDEHEAVSRGDRQSSHGGKGQITCRVQQVHLSRHVQVQFERFTPHKIILTRRHTEARCGRDLRSDK